MEHAGINSWGEGPRPWGRGSLVGKQEKPEKQEKQQKTCKTQGKNGKMLKKPKVFIGFSIGSVKKQLVFNGF